MDDQVEVAKWYTLARKFPQLIGKTPDGARLWGGPYTYMQVGVATVTVVLLVKLPFVWAHFSLFGNVFVFVGLVYGAVWAAGKLPFGMRNPLTMAEGWLRMLLPAPTGTIGGRPVTVHRPHLVSGRSVMVVDTDAPAGAGSAVVEPPSIQVAAVAQPVPVTSVPVAASAARLVVRPLTGVQLLLTAGRAG